MATGQAFGCFLCGSIVSKALLLEDRMKLPILFRDVKRASRSFINV